MTVRIHLNRNIPQYRKITRVKWDENFRFTKRQMIEH